MVVILKQCYVFQVGKRASGLCQMWRLVKDIFKGSFYWGHNIWEEIGEIKEINLEIRVVRLCRYLMTEITRNCLPRS